MAEEQTPETRPARYFARVSFTLRGRKYRGGPAPEEVVFTSEAEAEAFEHAGLVIRKEATDAFARSV